jgi:hypothetical protein
MLAEHKAISDKNRYVLKTCGACNYNGKLNEFGKNWTEHWKKMHKNIKPHGWIRAEGKGAEIHMFTIDQYELYKKHIKAGEPNLVVFNLKKGNADKDLEIDKLKRELKAKTKEANAA